MPTLNPRVNVTLSPALDLLVTRLAAHNGESKSQVLRELLEVAAPALERAVTLMDAAAKAGPGVLKGFADSLLRSQERIEDELEGSLGMLESADLVSQAQRINGRKGRAPVPAEPGPAPAPSRPGSASNPRASNRGVRSSKTRGPGQPGKPGKGS